MGTRHGHAAWARGMGTRHGHALAAGARVPEVEVEWREAQVDAFNGGRVPILARSWHDPIRVVLSSLVGGLGSSQEGGP